jgi:hypothetical protein
MSAAHHPRFERFMLIAGEIARVNIVDQHNVDSVQRG